MRHIPCYLEPTKYKKEVNPFTYRNESIGNGTTRVNFSNTYKNYKKLTQYNFGIARRSNSEFVLDANFSTTASAGHPSGRVRISGYNPETGELSISKNCNPNVSESIRIVCYGGKLK